MLVESRQALISYQDYHTSCFSSCDWPSFRTRITTCFCSLSQAGCHVRSLNLQVITTCIMLFELRQALFSYQDYHMSCLSS